MRAVLALVALVALARGQWHMQYRQLATIDLGISFIDANIGYTPGTLNGAGPAVFKTTDGAKTFEQCNVTNFGLDIMLLAVDAAANSVVVSSEAGELYSADGGKTFHQSLGGGLSQSVRHIGPSGLGGHKFGCAGYYELRKADGVAVSVNSGRTFQLYDAKLFTSARYGAFPTDTTWFVAAGEFPSNQTTSDDDNADDDGPFARIRPRGARIKSYVFTEDGQMYFAPGAKIVPKAKSGNSTNGYAAQLSKTTDGGQTWKTLFAENGTFYFNGIDCNPSNPDHCCAAGEGFTDQDGQSDEPGGRVHCTTDGGNTWNRTFWAPQNASNAVSLMEIRFSSSTEIWVAGGLLGNVNRPLFLHSTDGGVNWDVDVPEGLDPGALAVSLSFPTDKVGYTVMLNTVTQAASIGKYGL